MSCKEITIGFDINDLVKQNEERNINILTLWLYWIIVGEPEKRDSLNRKEE